MAAYETLREFFFRPDSGVVEVFDVGPDEAGTDEGVTYLRRGGPAGVYFLDGGDIEFDDVVTDDGVRASQEVQPLFDRLVSPVICAGPGFAGVGVPDAKAVYFCTGVEEAVCLDVED